MEEQMERQETDQNIKIKKKSAWDEFGNSYFEDLLI
jgi:hypothetical protein